MKMIFAKMVASLNFPSVREAKIPIRGKVCVRDWTVTLLWMS